VSFGPGLRWAVMGPSLQYHLGGGEGGIKHFMEHIFVGMAPVFEALGNPTVTPALKQAIIDGVTAEAGNRSVEEIAREENKQLIALLRLRSKAVGQGAAA
jgi:carnitine 3-dehydrogenase